MKKRILKVMSMMLVAATLMTGTGFNEVVTVKAETLAYGEDGYNQKGYDKDGYDREGYDYHGYDKNGYNREGYDRYGYDRDGYDKNGYDKERYDRDGYDYFYGRDKEGYDRDGYNEAGYDREGYNRDGYDVNGYDKEGYDHAGYGKDGYNREGYDKNGYDRDGYDENGYDKNHRDRNGKLHPDCVKKTNDYDIDKVLFTGKYGNYGLSINSGWRMDREKMIINIYTNDKSAKAAVKELKKMFAANKSNMFTLDSVTSVATKNGYGKYKLVLKYGDEYNNTKTEYELRVYPQATMDESDPNMSYLYTTKDALKYMDGVEYKILRGARKITKKYNKKGKLISIDIKAITTSKYKVIKKGSKKVKNLKAMDISKMPEVKKNLKSYGFGKKAVMAKLVNLNPNIDFKKKPKNFEETAKKMEKKIDGDAYVRYYVVVNGEKVYSSWM